MQMTLYSSGSLVNCPPWISKVLSELEVMNYNLVADCIVYIYLKSNV